MITAAQIDCELSRRHFWNYCQLISPEFYKDDRPHLKKLCDSLEMFYRGQLLKPNGEAYTKFMLNMPPRHGKSRTLVNFVQWCFGQNKKERVISASFNDLTANDFSRYIRDGIREEKVLNDQFVFSDVFPKVKVKKGDESIQKWALRGEFFSYLGAGIGGSFTSKGGSIKIIDDPIKNAEEALNETYLDKLWIWYIATWMSRDEGEPLEIVNHTRWSKKDISGRVLEEEGEEWYKLVMEVYDEATDTMLCPEIMSKKSYMRKRNLAVRDSYSKMIFFANYHQRAIDIQGSLYRNLNLYTKLPDGISEKTYNYTDTADEGSDYLCSISYKVLKRIEGRNVSISAYIVGVVYTQDPTDKSEPQLAAMLDETSTDEALIESNAGGRAYGRALAKYMREVLHNTIIKFKFKHQRGNKKARIAAHAGWVIENIYFPKDWGSRWPKFYEAVTSFQSNIGMNKHDDAADNLTGISETAQRMVRRKGLSRVNTPTNKWWRGN